MYNLIWGLKLNTMYLYIASQKPCYFTNSNINSVKVIQFYFQYKGDKITHKKYQIILAAIKCFTRIAQI